MLNNNSLYDIIEYKDQYGNLQKRPRTNKPFMVSGGKIDTGEVLVQLDHVYITGLNEIPYQQQLASSTQFKVDYTNGVIYFYNSSQNGNTLNLSFYASGQKNVKAINTTLIDADNNYPIKTVEAALQQNAQRINNLVINTANPAEVLDSHVDSVNNMTFTTQKARFDRDALDIKNIQDNIGDANTLQTYDNTSLTKSVNESLKRIHNIVIDVKYPPYPLQPCIMDGITNDLTRLQSIHNYIVQNYGFGELYIPDGVLTIKDTFYWDVDKVKISCRGVIEADINNNSKFAISTTNSNENSLPYRQSRTTIKEFQLRSKTQFSCNGMLFTGSSNTDNANIGASRLTFYGGYVTGFNLSLVFDKRSYLIRFNAFDIYANQRAIQVNDAYDSGENISFTDCAIFNNAEVIQTDNESCDVFFKGCSIDYNYRCITRINKGKVYINNCHLEHLGSVFTSTNRPFILGNHDANLLDISNSYIQFSSNTVTMDYVFENNLISNTSNSSGIYVDNCFLNGLLTTTLIMATGGNDNNTKSITQIKNTKAGSWGALSPITSKSMSLLSDPSLWNSDIINANFCSLISQDAVDYTQLTNKLSGINLEVYVDGVNGVANDGCIAIKKKSIAQTFATYTIVVPVNKLCLAGSLFKIKSSITDTVDLRFGFCNFDGKRIYDKDIKYNVGLIQVTTSYQDYVMPNQPFKNNKNSLNYAFLDIVLYNTNQNTIVYIDDIYITDM